MLAEDDEEASEPHADDVASATGDKKSVEMSHVEARGVDADANVGTDFA